VRESDASRSVKHQSELVLAEQSCCEFLNFSLTFDGPTISLTVTGPAHAQTLIA
jgi:MerR family transcriptional regulator, copper efflux regulator